MDLFALSGHDENRFNNVALMAAMDAISESHQARLNGLARLNPFVRGNGFTALHDALAGFTQG